MPPMKMQGDGRKAKNPKKTFLRLLSFLKPHMGRMIVILENGQIHAVGTHEELLQNSPIYQEVFYSQQKGGEE